MKYDELAEHAKRLNYRDQLRLAQLLIQVARKEGEQNSRDRSATHHNMADETVQYVGERLRKLKPTKQKSLFNSIRAMFQFRGGIEEHDLQKIYVQLQKQHYISVGNGNRIQYPDG